MNEGGWMHLLLPQLFLNLLSIYINLLHLFSLNQSCSCFIQLVPSVLSLVGLVYVFHPLYVPLPSSKHFRPIVVKHNHTTSHHLPYLLHPSIPTFPSAPRHSSCPPTTAHHLHHRSFYSS